MSKQAQRLVPSIIIALFVASALAPAVQATHLTLYTFRNPTTGESLDSGIGVTYEDDGDSARQPGGLLDGVQNKVVLNVTDVIGQGALFLDSQWYYHEQAYVASNYYLAPATGGKQMLYGSGGFMSWYGWWQDLDGDGRIDDHHDSGSCHATAPASCASVDEFTWKGAGSGDALEMVLYFLPSDLPNNGQDRGVDERTPQSASALGLTVGRNWGTFGAWANGTDARPDDTFDDRTEYSESEQLWVNGIGWPWVWTDESLLIESQTVVVANPGKSNSELRYKIEGADVSVDVDTYESVDPTVEALWVSTVTPIPGQVAEARRAPTQIGPLVNEYAAMVSAAINDVSRAINDLTNGQRPPIEILDEFLQDNVDPVLDDTVNPVVNNTLDLVNDTAAPYRDPAVAEVNALTRAANNNLSAAIEAYYNPAWLMEPNHVGDIYPGATFDGVPDYLGVGNDYTDHATEYHLFMDSHAVFQVPGGANIYTPLITYGIYGDTTYEGNTAHIDPTPCDGCGDSGRGFKPTFVTVKNVIGLWKDTNLDKHPGVFCDPEDPDGDWDSDQQVCGNRDTFGWDGWSGSEIIPICGTTTMNGGHVKVYPAPGHSWDDVTGQVIKLRLYDRPMYNAFNTDQMTMPTGNDVVELALDSCSGGQIGVRSVDMLFLPTGSLEISLIFEVTATMTKAFTDEDLGVDLPVESVTDVDIYLASL